MGFKSDREFLRNVSIGAIGTRKVATVLRRGGFDIIELERYCASNKIWATKIKRIRVPDLLCLKTGIRIESRAKSTLEVTMSHAVNNPDRAWDKGLRDRDLISFVRCFPDGDQWVASERISLFRVGEMRATAGSAGLSRMKAASEGSEIRLTWPAVVPRSSGTVTAVTVDRIETLLSNGRKQTYRFERKQSGALMAHLKVGDTFGDGDTIIASAMPMLIPPILPAGEAYDFLSDIESDSTESVYVATKALGFLPDLQPASQSVLTKIAQSYTDERVRLEAAASLARLGFEDGWRYLVSLIGDTTAPREYRMESALILSEIRDSQASAALVQMATNRANEPELRSACTWGLAGARDHLETLLDLAHDADELVAVHAIVAVSRTVTESDVRGVLELVVNDDRRAAGIVRSLLLCECDVVPDAVRQIMSAGPGNRRQWLLYLLAAKGRAASEDYLKSRAPNLLGEVDFFWSHQTENWTNRLDVADQIDFLAQQSS